MKYICYFGILCLFALGCNNKPKMTVEEQRVEDSLVKAGNYRIINRDRIRDSIANAEQNKVIGEIEFGMNKEIGEMKVAKFFEQSQRKRFESSTYTSSYIGNYEFNKRKTFDYYEDGKLYMFKIKGVKIPYQKLETEVRYQLDKILEVIELKYSEPYLTYPYPKSYEIDDDKDYTCAIWRIGTKEILITIDEEGTDYTVDVNIYQPNILDSIYNKQRRKELEKTEKAKEIF